MTASISKSQLKARALELMREVERTGKPLVITDRGRPVLKLVPFESQERPIESFRGCVLEYDDPFGPVDEDAWEAGL